jgi:hypothetical protein
MGRGEGFFSRPCLHFRVDSYYSWLAGQRLLHYSGPFKSFIMKAFYIVHLNSLRREQLVN